MSDPLLDMASAVQAGKSVGAPSPAAATAPAKTAPSGDPLLDMANSVMSSKAPAAPAAPAGPQPHETMPMDILGGAVEPIATMATGALGSLIGGAARLGSAALGSSYDDAKATGNKVADALTYHPQTQGGQQALAGLGNMATGAKNAIMSTPVGQAASAVGNAYDNTFVKGAPNALMATINDQVPTVTANVVAPAALGALKGAPNALRQAISGPASAVERIEPSIGPQVAQAAAPKPQGAMPGANGMAAARGSVGAAGTSYAEQARASGVPDAIVKKIADQEAAGQLNPTAAERHIEAGSLPVPVDLTAGQATGDVNRLSWEQNNRGKIPDLAERFNGQNGQLAANFDAIRDQVAPDVNVPSGSGTGQALIDAYKQMDAPVQQKISDAYASARNADGTSANVDASQAMRDFESQITPSRFRALPSRVQQMFSEGKIGSVDVPSSFDQSGGSTRPMTALDLMDIDQALSGEIAQTKNPSVAHDIGKLREAFSSASINPNAGADAVSAFKDAQAMARARFQAMDADPAYKASIGDGVKPGEPSPLADQFVQKYIAGGGGKAANANVQNMIQNLSGDPMNQQLMAAGLIDHLKQQAGIDLRTNTGNVSQAGLNKALSNLDQKTPLILGPQASQTLDALGNVARYTQEQPRGSFVNNSNTFVAGAANAAKSALEGAANLKAGGIPVGTWARQALAKRALGNEAAQSLEPGAGLNKLNAAMGGRR